MYRQKSAYDKHIYMKPSSQVRETGYFLPETYLKANPTECKTPWVDIGFAIECGITRVISNTLTC